MSCSLGTHHLRRRYCAILNVIEFETLRPPKVLEYRTSLVRHCNSHEILPFLRNTYGRTITHSVRAERNIATLYKEFFSIHKTVGHFCSCPFVNARYRSARHTHTSCCFLLAHLLQIKEANRLKLVEGQLYDIARGYPLWDEPHILGHDAYEPRPTSSASHVSPFLTYVIINYTSTVSYVNAIFDICRQMDSLTLRRTTKTCLAPPNRCPSYHKTRLASPQ